MKILLSFSNPEAYAETRGMLSGLLSSSGQKMQFFTATSAEETSAEIEFESPLDLIVLDTRVGAEHSWMLAVIAARKFHVNANIVVVSNNPTMGQKGALDKLGQYDLHVLEIPTNEASVEAYREALRVLLVRFKLITA